MCTIEVLGPFRLPARTSHTTRRDASCTTSPHHHRLAGPRYLRIVHGLLAVVRDAASFFDTGLVVLKPSPPTPPYTVSARVVVAASMLLS